MPSLLRRRLAAASLAAGLAVSLVACSGGDPEPTALPSKSEPAPVFASDEEAFAAAEEAYARFRDALQEVTDRGGEDYDGLEDVAVGAGLEAAMEAADSFAEAGWHTSGKSVVEVADRLQYFETRDRGAVVQMYFCEDVSGTDVLDAAGESVVGEGTSIIPRQLVFEGTSAEGMKVSEWSTRGTFCQQ